MSRNAVARNYGGALFEAARDQKALPQVLEDLDLLEQALQTELQALLLSPRVPLALRISVVREVFAQSSPVFRSFLELVLRKGRAGSLLEIIEETRRLDNEAAGRAICDLTLAAELGDGLQEEIRQQMSRLTGLELRLRVRQDPRLLGGFIAQVGDQMLDASLKTRLEQLRHHLLTA